jgi:hypothetical protein
VNFPLVRFKDDLRFALGHEAPGGVVSKFKAGSNGESGPALLHRNGSPVDDHAAGDLFGRPHALIGGLRSGAILPASRPQGPSDIEARPYCETKPGASSP